MKTMRVVRLCAAALFFSTGTPLFPIFAAESEVFARIKSVQIESTNIVVEVEASGGFTKVTLESSTRLGRRAWEPRAVKVVQAGESVGGVASTTFTLTLPISPSIEILRVRGDLVENSLPANFYTGTNKFVASGGSSAAVSDVPGANTSAPTRDSLEGGGGAARAVVESDIWKIEGDSLFFFNQYRGLQVIDVATPDSPVVSGSYDLPGAGEQMYVINGTNVVLLARDNCSWYGSESQSRVVLLQVRDGVPHFVKELPVPGHIDESRLVGSALYLVANSYQRRPVETSGGTATGETWEWGSQIVSFDLSDFESAQEKSRDWVRGYGNVIMATDQYLFVSQTNYEVAAPPYVSTVHCYDISSPRGSFEKLSSFGVGGIVKDKFKMNVDGDTFVAVVQLDNWQINQRATYVRTYSLANPRQPVELGNLLVIRNEQLFATRFDGDRLYVVTFFVIDPLWIIDLSNPAAPKKVGELEIPGWSTFLQPMGDRLLAIGIDRTTNGSTRTAVQLFGVADPANPVLLSKVLIGDQWSGSEANWDEKAFGVLPEDKLVLVPFYSSGTQGFFQGVQLIDLEPETLVKRGVVEHNMGARRATLHRGRLLSLSSHELLTVDVANRDKPTVVNETQLSWAADRVHLAGNHVIEVDANSSGGPVLRVVDANDPSTLRTILALTNLPYMGSIESGGKLYVLQGRGKEYVYPTEYNPTNYFPIATNPSVYLFSEISLTGLPDLSIARRTLKQGDSEYFYGHYQPLFVKPDLLVWANKGYGYSWWYRGGVFDGGPVATSRMADSVFAPIELSFWPWWGGASGHLIAVDLAGETPEFASEVTLTGTNGWWNFGDAFTTDGLVYTSHQASEFDPEFDPPPYVYGCWNGREYVTCTNDPPPGIWVQRYYLDVVDFSDPHDPLVRKPVNIPGTLIGLKGGEMLYTRGYEGSPFVHTGEETISALSYDGVLAHQIARLQLNQSWPRPALADNGYVFIGNPATTNNTNATLQVWTISNEAKFEMVESVTLDTAAQELEKVNDLLVVQSNDIDLYDARNPVNLEPIGSGTASLCYGVLLDASDGEVDRGLWVPVGWYGVIRIPVGAGQ